MVRHFPAKTRQGGGGVGVKGPVPPPPPMMDTPLLAFIRLGTTIGLGSLLENHYFDPFWSHLWSQIGPFSRPFRP